MNHVKSPKFGKASLGRLNTVDPRLVEICHLALKKAGQAGRDFSIIEGWRCHETQMKLLREGKSKLASGKHNVLPSLAIDFMPWHDKYRALTGNDAQIMQIADGTKTEIYATKFKVMGEFYIIASCFFQAAAELGYPIRWGGDWNMNNDVFDNNFDDIGHIELC